MIIPLIVPDVKIDTFLHLASQGVGTVSKAIDESKRPLTIYEKFISGLFSLKRSADINKTLNSAGTLLNHLSFTIAAIEDPEVISESMEKTSLTHTVVDAKNKKQIAIISGTLLQFKLAILECTTEWNTDQLRYMYDEVYLFFEEAGFREVLHFRKIPARSGLFRLEQK